MALLGLMAALSVIFTNTVISVASYVFGVSYVVLSVFVVIETVVRLDADKNEDRHGPWSWLARRELGVLSLLVLFTSPVLVAFAAVAIVLGSLIGFLIWLFGDKQFHELVLEFLIEPHHRKLPWLRPWLAIPAAVFATAPFFKPSLVIAIVIVAIVVVVAVLALLAWLSDKAKERAQAAEEGQDQATTELDTEKAVDKPSVAGDFLQLIWAFILARKYKICPVVTIKD